MIARQCRFEDLPAWVDVANLSRNGHGHEMATYIVIEDGPYRAVYSDAMEREDACFCRDLSWIVKEINMAATARNK